MIEQIKKRLPKITHWLSISTTLINIDWAVEKIVYVSIAGQNKQLYMDKFTVNLQQFIAVQHK